MRMGSERQLCESSKRDFSLRYNLCTPLTLVITILWVVATEFRGGGRRSDYAGATAPPVRLGARRHQSAHGAQKNHVQPIRLATMIMPNGE